MPVCTSFDRSTHTFIPKKKIRVSGLGLYVGASIVRASAAPDYLPVRVRVRPLNCSSDSDRSSLAVRLRKKGEKKRRQDGQTDGQLYSSSEQ